MEGPHHLPSASSFLMFKMYELGIDVGHRKEPKWVICGAAQRSPSWKVRKMVS